MSVQLAAAGESGSAGDPTLNSPALRGSTLTAGFPERKRFLPVEDDNAEEIGSHTTKVSPVFRHWLAILLSLIDHDTVEASRSNTCNS